MTPDYNPGFKNEDEAKAACASIEAMFEHAAQTGKAAEAAKAAEAWAVLTKVVSFRQGEAAFKQSALDLLVEATKGLTILGAEGMKAHNRTAKALSEHGDSIPKDLLEALKGSVDITGQALQGQKEVLLGMADAGNKMCEAFAEAKRAAAEQAQDELKAGVIAAATRIVNGK